MVETTTRARPQLRRLRRLAGLSVRELADLMKVSAPTISGYETGNRTPGPDKLNKLARVLGVKVETLVDILDGTCAAAV